MGTREVSTFKIRFQRDIKSIVKVEFENEGVNLFLLPNPRPCLDGTGGGLLTFDVLKE